MDDNINSNFLSKGFSEVDSSQQNLTLNLSPAVIKSITSWATFRAIMEIIYGAFSCLGIVTAAYGIPMILSGVKLLKAVDDLKMYLSENNTQKISEAFVSLSNYFKMRGITTIVMICTSIVIFIIYIAVIAYLVSNSDTGGLPGLTF